MTEISRRNALKAGLLAAGSFATLRGIAEAGHQPRRMPRLEDLNPNGSIVNPQAALELFSMCEEDLKKCRIMPHVENYGPIRADTTPVVTRSLGKIQWYVEHNVMRATTFDSLHAHNPKDVKIARAALYGGNVCTINGDVLKLTYTLTISNGIWDPWFGREVIGN